MGVTDVTDATFETAVLDRSAVVPVVVDLWADWCGPCRTLGPVLERVVDATDGRVELAKVDVDANPRIAASFGVQSIPAVVAIVDGAVVVTGAVVVVGAVGEAAVTEFVARLTPAPSEADQLAEAGDEASLRKALALQADHPRAAVALAEMLARRGDIGDVDEALELLARLPETADVRRVAAVARVGPDVAADPGSDDVATRIEGLLDRVKTDEAARRELLDLLEVLGPEDPRTPQFRRALASRLY